MVASSRWETEKRGIMEDSHSDEVLCVCLPSGLARGPPSLGGLPSRGGLIGLWLESRFILR